MKRAAALAALTLAACAPQVEPGATARHVSSNVAYGDGARMHLFIFDPNAPRPLADRKAIAQRTIANDPNCVWVDAPDTVLIDATARQGTRFTETLLVAPVRCT